MKKRIAFVFGTRPEIIKIAPLIKGITRRNYPLRPITIFTGQHREIAESILLHLNISPDISLDVMMRDQKPSDVLIKILKKLDRLFKSRPPDMVIVQGDTTTTLAASLAAFYRKIPVAHIEAGLRTWDKSAPFPEEMNRCLTTALADYHFAPTPAARGNLIRSGVPKERIFVTGNTVVDGLRELTGRLSKVEPPLLRKIAPGQKLILLTVHRRENFGPPLADICGAVRELVRRIPDVQVIVPVHPNPNVRKVMHRRLGRLERVHLTAPLDYLPFLSVIQRSDIILTDSGGVVEEAPSFGKPVLILREKTERNEAVQAHLARLVGTDPAVIVRRTIQILEGKQSFTHRRKTGNPFGDGRAAGKILRILSAMAKHRTPR